MDTCFTVQYTLPAHPYMHPCVLMQTDLNKSTQLHAAGLTDTNDPERREEQSKKKAKVGKVGKSSKV